MLLLIFLLAGLLIGQLRGGGLSGLVRMGLRAPWLVLLPFLVEFSFRFLPPVVLERIPYGLYVMQCLRFIPLLLFALLNLRNWRIAVVGLGVAMNFAVILANGAQMPISSQALEYPQLNAQVQRVLQGAVPEYVLMDARTLAPLWFLADILIVPFPVIGFASAGDVVLGIGTLLAVQNGMARYAHGRHVRGSLATEPYVRRRRAEEPLDSGPMQSTEDVMEHMTAPVAEPAPHTGTPAIDEQPTVDQWVMAEMPNEPLETAELSALPLEPSQEPEPVVPVPTPVPEPEPDDLVPPPVQQAAPGQPHDEPPLTMAAPVPAAQGEAAQPMELPPRLLEIAAMIPRWASVADVGCDHGKLAVYLAERGSPLVIATDISAKSLGKAKKLVREHRLQNIVKTRSGDGLQRIRPGEVDVVVMAGMGGPTICAMLDGNLSVVGNISRLVLQPQNAVGTVRAWLLGNGFRLERESIVEDEGRLYQVLCAVPGIDDTRIETLFDQEIGSMLVRDRHPLLPRLLQERVATIDTILSEISGSQTSRAESRRIELLALRTRCMEVLSWLAR